MERFHATESDLVHVRVAMDVTQNVPASSADPPDDISDPDDAPIVACALAAGAELFVTGDKALLAMQSVGAMSVVSPREMYERLIRGR
jgi:predicted nucleic acid-binding protein